MTITIDEKFDSREATVGEESTIDLLYAVQGTEDDLTVKLLVEASSPPFYAGLVRQSYHVSHLGGGVWDASVRYGKKEPKEPGDLTFSFDTGGGTQHITQSLSTVHRYPGTAPDFKG